jgi:hypothetical protein
MELFDLQWPRCLDGYRLTHRQPKESRSLRKGTERMVSLIPPGADMAPGWGIESASVRFEWYHPARIQALFRIFADAPATPEGICEFSKKFGIPSSPLSGVTMDNRTFEAHSVSPLLVDHRTLRRAIALLDSGDSSALERWFNSGRVNVGVKIQCNAESRISYVLVPSGLIDLMWLQFAQHAASEAKLLRCARCSSPIRVGTGTGRRSSSKYCSPACRLAAFKGRKNGAEHSHA